MQQRKTLKALTLLGGLMFGLSNAAQADCGTIELGDFDWNSAKLHSAIGTFILENGYGCDVKTTTGSTIPIMASLYEQDLDVVMEVWYDNIIDQFDPAEAAGKVRRVGVNTPDSAQGFYIDKTTADAHGIKSVEDMKTPEIAALFKDPENPDKGRMTSCIGGWTCYTINLVKHKSYGLDEYYTNFDPGNGGALDAAIKGGFDKGTPVFTYYWEPTALMGSVELVKLEEPAFDADVWAEMMKVVDTVKADGPEALTMVAATAYNDMALPIGISTRLDADEPEVVEFFKNYTISSAGVSALLDHYLNEADGEADITAMHFLKTSSDWESWVPADVAAKVKAAL
ncbi:MAG: glycine betaine/proline transport system substrate-binding protein [Saprospiraceae bacterium]|jgi:glycine betaine/proline transport system substrate-binding protein